MNIRLVYPHAFAIFPVDHEQLAKLEQLCRLE